MLKVKLTRTGKRNQVHYRIVVNEARDKRDGKYVENLGYYAPVQNPKLLEINIERYNYWIGQGAQPTDTVAALVKRFKSGNPFPAKKKKKLNKKAKARLAAEKEEVKAEESSSAKALKDKKETKTEASKEVKKIGKEKKEEPKTKEDKKTEKAKTEKKS